MFQEILTFANGRYAFPLAARRTNQRAFSFDHLVTGFALELHQRVHRKPVTDQLAARWYLRLATVDHWRKRLGG